MSAATAPNDPLQAIRPLAVKALGLVLATTLLFWVAGAIRGDSGGVVVDGVTSGDVAGGDDGGDVAAPVDDASSEAEPTAEESTTAEKSTPEESAEPSEESAEPSEEPTATEEPSEEPTAEASEEPAATPAGEIAPSSVSIQVLDAVLNDGGKAANAVAARLRSAGYRVVVVNKASRVYDDTTVFYSSSNGKGAADQVAKQFGFPDVNAKPDNLSNSVTLHLAVGRDER